MKYLSTVVKVRYRPLTLNLSSTRNYCFRPGHPLWSLGPQRLKSQIRGKWYGVTYFLRSLSTLLSTVLEGKSIVRLNLLRVLIILQRTWQDQFQYYNGRDLIWGGYPVSEKRGSTMSRLTNELYPGLLGSM